MEHKSAGLNTEVIASYSDASVSSYATTLYNEGGTNVSNLDRFVKRYSLMGSRRVY